MKYCYEKAIYNNTGRSCFRRTGILTILFLLTLSINIMAQSAQKVSLNVKNVPVSAAIDALQKQVKLYFVYTHEQVNALPKVSLKVKDQPLDKVLEQLLTGSGLEVIQIKYGSYWP